ncbi:DnaJ domain-containing protein [Candidatus Mycoplasma haematolamae str. Purdue]|uniref:Transcription termination/antitermination protein NusG n=1 Tax=Mycoplasma haematolamae (strain Purdue) TaxID=1212765 RepID=I7CIB5_MYCHA|nr:transcription termination/antitermination protein NusG [Candidatus Mycoplasma haematolamae]AFO51589.1 DnaJ domain-containing protein [Candidatus Mycoplasma haematolamae str. Purdue]
MNLFINRSGETELEDDFLDDEKFGPSKDAPRALQWYTARTFSSNEDRLIETLWDKIRQCKLESEIKDILSIKEMVVHEGEEITHDSGELPKTEFRNSKSSMWVQLKNGNFKRLRLKVRRPFKCFIFIQMYGDFELFDIIQRWQLGLNFLGFPCPNIVSDAEIEKMKGIVSEEAPSLEEYVKDKDYKVVTGAVNQYISLTATSDYDESEIDDAIELREERHEETTIAEFDSFEPTDAESLKDRKDINIDKLKVNDFVYLSDMGAKGVVHDIDLKNKLITVNINLFGRNQIIKCSPEQLKEF